MNKKHLEPIVTHYNTELIQPFDTIYKFSGYDFLYELVSEFGGTTLYIPTKKRLFTPCVEKHILSEFDGYNYKELARLYDLSEKKVRLMVNQALKEASSH